MKRLLTVFGLAVVLTPPAWAQIEFKPAGTAGAAATSIDAGTTVVTGKTDCFGFADASGLFQCDNTLAKLSNAGAGNGVLTVLKSPSGSSLTSNFVRFTGTNPALSAQFRAFYFGLTTTGSDAQIIRGLFAELLAGSTTTQATNAIFASNAVAGTGADLFAGTVNSGVTAFSTQVTTGTNAGLHGTAGGGNVNAGVVGKAAQNKAGAVNVGVAGFGSNGDGAPGARVGGYFGLNVSTPTFIESALLADNAATAAPIIVARDNGAALPSTGATATWQIQDGAWPQLGNGVLTTGTATATVQARESGSLIHAYDITTAMINTALGAGTTGDVLMATLPAKTVVKNAYVIITQAAAGPATLTIACGRTSAAYIDYIVASDAKAAANTVYGDASGERGTNLTGYDLPSYTATTAVNCHFVAGDTTDLTTGTQRLILETSLVP